jgi:hypothetical protein
MTTLKLRGRITELGKLEVDLPETGLKVGDELKVIVEIPEKVDEEIPWEERPWTKEELRELMTPDPKTGAEIVAMIKSGELDTSEWVAMNITDSVEWIEQMREQERKNRESGE